MKATEMKKTLLSLSFLLLLFSFAIASENWIGFTSDIPQLPQVNIEETDASRIVLDIVIPGMNMIEIEENGNTYQKLELLEFQTTTELGKPELPMINQIIGIPDNHKVKFNVLETSTTKLDNYLVYPFQTPEKDIKGGKSDEFVIDKKFYNSNISYPESNVYLDEPGIWRDVKISGFHFVPFTYNPSTKELNVITHLKVEIVFYGYDSDNILNRSKEITPPFYRMYESAIVNFGSLGYRMKLRDNSDIKYLIITNTEALATIQPFVDWKNEQGFPVEIRTLETGFNTPQNFKDYIAQLYESDNLEYVLMVGDAYPNGGNPPGPNDVPMFWWQPSGEDGSYSDTWYVCLDGPDDHYADLAIGRFTYDENHLDELALQIQKTMDHYQNPDAETNWAEHTILVAHQENYPLKYTQCKEEIRTFPYAIQVPIFQQCYGGAGATNQDIINFINTSSCGIFNYRGHGSQTEFWQWGPSGSFTNTHIQQFTNNNRLFVLFDVCCDNMDIVAYNGDCLCESFMKSPVAAIAINGAIIPSYTIPNHDYDKEMYKAVFNEGIYNIGYVTNFANVYVLNVHGTWGRSNVRTYLWLGDSSLEPWTLQPSDLIVSHDGQLFLGLSEFDVSVMGTAGPIENARVCVSNADGTIYGIAFTDASGFAQVQFDEPVQSPGEVTVTVTTHNYLPYQSVIPVIPQEGPYVVQESYTINDNAGNGNGLMDFGEAILLSLSVENVGITEATDVTVNINTTDPYITMTDTTEFYGNVPAGQVVTIDDGFAFTVADDIPDGHYVLFNVQAISDTFVWDSNFSVEGHAPILEYDSFTIDDTQGNGDGKVDPGESANIIIKV
ncbi:MAG: hypothetical protein DRH57_08715, partial [Candidatus Cloacimonadota bacterium]